MVKLSCDISQDNSQDGLTLSNLVLPNLVSLLRMRHKVVTA